MFDWNWFANYNLNVLHKWQEYWDRLNLNNKKDNMNLLEDNINYKDNKSDNYDNQDNINKIEEKNVKELILLDTTSGELDKNEEEKGFSGNSYKSNTDLNEPGNIEEDINYAEARKEKKVFLNRFKIFLFLLLVVIFIVGSYYIYEYLFYSDKKIPLIPIFTKSYSGQIYIPKDVIPYIDLEEFEKALEKADLKSVNRTMGHFELAAKELRKNLELVLDAFRINRIRKASERLKEYKQFKEETNINLYCLNFRYDKLLKRQSSFNIINIKVLKELKEQEFNQEVKHFKSGDYVFYNGSDQYSKKEGFKKMITFASRKGYAEALVGLLPQDIKNNSEIEEEFIYEIAYEAACWKRKECLKVFVAHGLNLNKLKLLYPQLNRDY